MRLTQLALATLLSASMALPAFAQTTPATPPATTTPARPATVAAPATTPAAPPAVATPARPATTATTRPAPTTKPVAAPTSINTASAADLDKLKGIGPARAKKIIEGRPYKAVDELDSKKVIPHNVYMNIKDQLTL